MGLIVSLPTEIKYIKQDIVCEHADRVRILVLWPTESVLTAVVMEILEVIPWVIPCALACTCEFSSRRTLLQELRVSIGPRKLRH